jgi:hypothetical protein
MYEIYNLKGYANAHWDRKLALRETGERTTSSEKFTVSGLDSIALWEVQREISLLFEKDKK